MKEGQEMALVRFGLDPGQIVHEDGRYWMTAEQLGTALGYRDPKHGVLRIYNRHKKELQPFAGVVKLTTPGGLQETTIFDTDGQYYIALMANTPKAATFRAFVVSMLKALEREEFIHVSKVREWQKRLIELDIRDALDKSRTLDRRGYEAMKRYRKMGLTQRETAKLLDVTRDTVQKFERIPRQYELTLLKGGAL